MVSKQGKHTTLRTIHIDYMLLKGITPEITLHLDESSQGHVILQPISQGRVNPK
jgi:hypothetical protein